MRATDRIESLALISSIALSVANFRGPLIKRLVAQGVRVYALAPDYTDQTRDSVIALGAEPIDISLDRTGMRPVRDVLDLIRLARQLRSLGPDATFSYFVKPVIYGSLAAALARVPYRYAMVAGLGYVFIASADKESWRRQALRRLVNQLYKLAFRVCDSVFFQNDDDIAHFVDRGLIEPRKAMRVNGTGVDLQHFLPTPPVTEPITFLLMARLLREKGIVEYVEAARDVKARHPTARFILLGELDSNPGCLVRAEVETWVRGGLLEWPGHVDDVRPWIAQSSVYVLPSYREGVPRSTQEAMAMGRAVISTNCTGCRETVDEGVNGFLVPVRDSAALAAAMLRFIEQPTLLDVMGRASRRLAEERFDVDDINTAILERVGIGPDSP